MATLASYQVTDDLTDNLASYHNRLLGGLFRSEFKNAENLSATRTLLDVDTPFQRLNCNGADRIVKMPTANTTENHPYFIVNSTSSGTYKLTVQDNSGAVTLAILNPNEFALMMPDANGSYEAVNRIFTKIVSPSQITANQNDYNPTSAAGSNVLRLNSDASRDITGFGFPAGAKTILVHNVGSFNIVLKDESASSTAANRFALTGDLTLTPDMSVMLWYDVTSSRWRMVGGSGSSSSNAYGNLYGIDGHLLNGKISVTVATNNITVAIKTLAGTDPSAGDPVYVRINGTVRSITSALSVTKNAGTNWFNAGASEHATIEIDYFVYLIWNTTPVTDVIDIGFARLPNFRVYSDASGTTTNEKYLAYGNGSAPTSTDDLVNIGRFGATLSVGASYNWSVPTFTSSNLIQRPIYETRWTAWTPTFGGFSSAPTNIGHYYKIVFDHIWLKLRQATNGTSNANTFTITPPFNQRSITNMAYDGMGTAIDNGVAKTTPIRLLMGSSVIDIYSDMTTATGWTASGGKRIGSGFVDYPIG
jgi:hypothetical protein